MSEAAVSGVYRPLEGIRVVELTVAWAGPLAGRILAELGADVVKVEHPTSRGLAQGSSAGYDPAPWEWGTLPPPEVRNGTYPRNDPGARWWNRLGYFNKINRGKRSLCLDVKAPGGQAVFDALVRRADLVLNNYSPRGVLSLGIDHPTLRKLNPNLVTVDLSGYGHRGPGAEQVSWGPILDASSGLAATTGYPDSGPYKQGLAFPDAVGGLHGAFAAMTALWEHELTGGPVHVDVSQQETLLGLGGDLLLEASVTGVDPPRRANRSALYAPQGLYRCAGDDEWLALTVEDDGDWTRLVGVIGDAGLDGIVDRHADHDRIDESITAWATSRTKQDAAAQLQAAGLAAAPVNTNKDLFEDPHLAARNFFVDLEHDGETFGFPGFPIHFGAGDVDIRPTPALGQHNVEVLTELGWSGSQIAELDASGTIATSPPT